MNGSRYVRRLPRFFGSPVMRLWSLETQTTLLCADGRLPFRGRRGGGPRGGARTRSAGRETHKHTDTGPV